MRIEELDIGEGEVAWHILATKSEAAALAACASTDVTRENLNCIVTTRVGVAATNGHMAVRWRDDEADSMPKKSFGRVLHRSVVAAAAKACGEGQLVALPVEADGDVLIYRDGGDMFDAIAARFDSGTELKPADYPDIERVFGGSTEPGFGSSDGYREIGFSPSLMALVATTCKRFGVKALAVKTGGPTDPIFLRAADGGDGGGVFDVVWMPMRVADERPVAVAA